MDLTGRVSWDDREPLAGATVEVRGPQRRRVRHWEYTESLHLLGSATTSKSGRFSLPIEVGPSDHLSVLVKTPKNGIVYVGRLVASSAQPHSHSIVVPRAALDPPLAG